MTALTQPYATLATEPIGAALKIILIGIVATLATDLWHRAVQTIAELPPAPWGLVGRWVAWWARGVFVHRPITATPKVQGELAIGWAFHYAVGIVYAALYLAIVALDADSGPTLGSALVFAMVLLVAPWFVLQPALGLGFMAARAPNPGAVRAFNIATHAIFGVGLYVGVVAARLVDLG